MQKLKKADIKRAEADIERKYAKRLGHVAMQFKVNSSRLTRLSKVTAQNVKMLKNTSENSLYYISKTGYIKRKKTQRTDDKTNRERT